MDVLDTSLFVRKANGVVDMWRTRDAALESIAKQERGTPLRRAFLRWKRGLQPVTDTFDDAAPATSADPGFDPGDLSYFRIDTLPEDPLDFRIIVPEAPGLVIRIGDLGTKILRRMLPIEFNIVKCTRCVSYQRIHQRIDDIVREYYRLLLPVPDQSFRIARLHCFSRPAHSTTKHFVETDGHV